MGRSKLKPRNMVLALHLSTSVMNSCVVSNGWPSSDKQTRYRVLSRSRFRDQSEWSWVVHLNFFFPMGWYERTVYVLLCEYGRPKGSRAEARFQHYVHENGVLYNRMPFKSSASSTWSVISTCWQGHVHRYRQNAVRRSVWQTIKARARKSKAMYE